MKKVILLIVLLAGAGFMIQAQTVRYVDNNQGAPTNAGLNYTSIQSAVNDSAPGDIIYVQPSPNSYGDIQMTKSLKIYGLAHNPELNNGQYAYFNNILFRYADASSSIISGLFIIAIYLDSTTYNNHDVVITNNRISTQINGNSTTTKANNAIISGNFFYHDHANYIDNYNSQNWVISNNIFERTNSYWGYNLFYRMNNTTIFNNNIILSRQNGDSNQDVRVFSTCSGTQISNNIFLFTGNAVDNFTNLTTNSALNFQNNLTYSVGTTIDALTGANNIDNADPEFVNWNSGNSINNPTHDYTIQGGSPAENAGTDGFDLGVMNGAFPFNLRGYPTSLPYLTDFVIFNNILSEGTDLNINVKADSNNN